MAVVCTALIVFDKATHDDVLTAVVTIVVGSAYVGWYFWSNRYR